MTVVIGDIPEVIVPDFQQGRCTGLTIDASLTVGAVFAIGAILSVSAGISFVALFAFLAGCLYAEGNPALTVVIGDIPKVIVPDF